MKYTALRLYMRRKLHANHCLEANQKECDLVIDGNSYFNDTYKTSGCGHVYGAECDKYAEYLKDRLSCFVESDTKCYVIFSGCSNASIDKREETHQKIVAHRSDDKVRYFEPAFVDDVQRDVLKELNIKYINCEYDSTETIIGVARKFKCPVLTDNIEYTLYGVSCIIPRSVKLIEETLEYDLYEHEKVKSAFGVYAAMPLFLTLLNEYGVHFENLAKIIECEDNSKIVSAAVRWVKKQRKEAIQNVTRKLHDETARRDFLSLYKKIELIYKYPRGALAVKYYFKTEDDPLLFRYDKKWFSKGVTNGRIAVPHIDLKKSAMFTGSQLMFDRNQPDAMLAAKDIISYSFNLLTNFQKPELSFIGREVHSCRVVPKLSIPQCINSTKRNCVMTSWPLLTVRNKNKIGNMFHNQELLFKDFFGKKLPGFVKEDLEQIPEGCWTLVISLIYYVCCVNKDFEFGAYCVLLSYVLLGPVAKTINKSLPLLIATTCEDDFSDSNLKFYKDCKAFKDGLESLFKTSGPVVLRELNLGLIHSLAEFQHCLQNMNYLFRLCAIRVPPSVYHRTYNGTFVYNVYLRMKNKGELMFFLNNQFKSSSVLSFYEKIVKCFESCLKSVKNSTLEKAETI